MKKIWQFIEIDQNTLGIPLTKNRVALIDREDACKVKDFTWCIKGNGYVVTNISHKVERTKSQIQLHNLIAKSKYIDHKDNDKLNNRKSNLRPCEHYQNMCNHKVHINNKLGFTGISFQRNRYRTRINVNGKEIHIGAFKTLNEAFIARKNAEIKYHGEFRYQQ